MLNTKVNHKGYWADSTRLGVEVCKRAPSPRVKLLYDIYHMQIMEGDVIRTIRDNIGYIGHFHTAGNPGRHEIDRRPGIELSPHRDCNCGGGIHRIPGTRVWPAARSAEISGPGDFHLRCLKIAGVG